MRGEDVLRQLLWKHEATLTGLAQELGGADASCALRDQSGRLAWDSRQGASGSGDAESSRPIRWVVPLAGIGRLEIRTDSPHASPGGPIELPSLGRFLVASMETEEELDRLVEDHIANTNQLVALYHIIAATHETWDLSEKLDVMLEEAGRQIGTSLAFLEVREQDASRIFLWPGDEPFRRSRAEAVIEVCRAHGDAFVGDEPEPFVAAPILVRGEVVGWLGAGERPVGDPLGQRDLKHVAALAELTAGFLQTARLQNQVVANTKLQREVEIASQIQDMLMPRTLPRLSGVGVAASCRPASSVGGDFFVVQELADGRLAFALGDVTGKGVPAALLMAMTRTVFRSLTPLSMSADVVLERLSSVLYQDLEEVGKFVTLVLGFWDPARGMLQVANAGHSPVLYRERADGPLVTLEPELPPLGVLPDPIAAPLELAFGPGALFVACSDGVTEARDRAGAFYGEERLTALVSAAGRAPADRLRARILEDVELFAGGAPQSDDQTILVLSRVPDLIPRAEPPSRIDLKPERGELARWNAHYDRTLNTARAGLEGTLDPQVAEEMKLAVHEALANLIEHGSLPSGLPLSVRLDVDQKGIRAEIESGGPAFDPGAKRAEPPAPEDLLEGGYGLYLIQTLTDELSLESGAGDRNRLTLTRRWGPR